MEFDFNSALFALSYALDCVEHDLLGVTTHHGKRVAAISILLGQTLGVLTGYEDRQMLSACAVLHDCALSEYIQDEFGGSFQRAIPAFSNDLKSHCSMGEDALLLMPFDRLRAKGAILYHHENADGSGPFGKTADQLPPAARLIQIADTVDASFDLSWLDREKRENLLAYLQKNTRTLFPAPEAEALIRLLTENRLEELRNEKIDLYLRTLLPGGQMHCTPMQLMDFARLFARIVDYKSHFTKTHSVGIAEKARDMAIFYGKDDVFAAKIYFAGALHDIGKLVVDRDILEKPGKLDRAEYKHIQTHAYFTYKILSDIPGLDEVTKWASHHHEKLDGSGYPFGLKAEQLGRWERLMACLDIYQALTEERPYKPGMSHQTAIKILSEMADAGQLDSTIVRDLDARFAPAF